VPSLETPPVIFKEKPNIRERLDVLKAKYPKKRKLEEPVIFREKPKNIRERLDVLKAKYPKKKKI